MKSRCDVISLASLATQLGVEDRLLIQEMVRATERVFGKRYFEQHGYRGTIDVHELTQDLARFIRAINIDSERSHDDE
jgi:hypothetical protein